MKASHLALTGLLAVAGSASAQSGMIDFQGQVVTHTCVVSANGSGTADATIALPTVAAPSIEAPGSRAAMQRFNIVVGSPAQPCLAASVSALWNGQGANVDPASGRLNNTVGPSLAQGVQVALLNDQQQDIDLRSNANSQVINFQNGVATLEYHGEYYGTGNPTPGMVATSVEYELDYR